MGYYPDKLTKIVNVVIHGADLDVGPQTHPPSRPVEGIMSVVMSASRKCKPGNERTCDVARCKATVNMFVWNRHNGLR